MRQARFAAGLAFEPFLRTAWHLFTWAAVGVAALVEVFAA
jgi:hypothetical protein